MKSIKSFNSLPFRLALFFAVNPDEELTTGDVATKFDVPQNDVTGRLDESVKKGLFVKRGEGAGRGRQAVYVAGDQLLQMVGGATQRAMISACAPLPLGNVSVSARTDN